MPIPMPSGLVNPLGLAAALLIIPLIILYLLKPKPKQIKFPTIRFIKEIEEIRRFSSFFNKFIRDPLLLIQIFMIALLAIALANPFALSERTIAENEAIAIVIDGSASMQAMDVSPTRFEAAIAKAKDIVSNAGSESEVSIIVAENIPLTILSNGNPKRALTLLGKLSCGDTPSNTADSLMLAKDLLSQSSLKKTAYLISDFSSTEGDVLSSSKILKMNGINVDFIKFNNDGKNIGIIDLEAVRTPLNRNILYLTYTVRNYDDVEHEITGKVYINDLSSSIETKSIKPMSDELFYNNATITQDKFLVKVEIDGGGALEVDDRAYAVIPELRSYRTMLLTSEDADKFVSYAIEAQLNNRLRIVEPPVIPPLSEFDTIIIGSIKKDSILPGTFRDIKNFVENGGSLIVMGSQELAGALEDKNLENLMPVKPSFIVNQDKNIKSINHEILKDVSLDNVVVKRFYMAEAKENVTVIAETEGSPLIAYWSYGKGKVAYLGINPSKQWSSLQYSSSFPIFWSQLIEFVNQREKLVGSFNLHTGEYLVIDKLSDVTNPLGTKTTSRSIFLDKEGFYTMASEDASEVIAANLVNEQESEIKTVIYDEGIVETGGTAEKTDKEDLFRQLLVLALIILFVEMVLYRRRGLI